jgi:hypothetical protein
MTGEGRSLSPNPSHHSARAQRRRPGAITAATAPHGQDEGDRNGLLKRAAGDGDYLDYIKNYIKHLHSAGQGAGFTTRIWAIAWLMLDGDWAIMWLHWGGRNTRNIVPIMHFATSPFSFLLNLINQLDNPTETESRLYKAQYQYFPQMAYHLAHLDRYQHWLCSLESCQNQGYNHSNHY